MRLSSRALAAVESETLRLSNEAARLRSAGREILSLLEGEPDLPVPEPIVHATTRALESGQTRYSSSTGLSGLKMALFGKLSDVNAIVTLPENILITNGAKQAIYEVLQALCGPGDEVVIPAPCWVTFPESVKLSGAKPVLVDTGADHQLDLPALRRAITAKTKALILNTPNNPTGAVYREKDLHSVVELANEHDLIIIADEAYEALVYEGARHVSVAALGKDAAARTVTVQTFSKSFGMTGYRVGYACGPAELMQAVGRIHGHVTGNVCTFAQLGALHAVVMAFQTEHRETWRAEHQKRRDAAFELGARLFDCVKPQGGLFLFADARRHLGKRFKTSAALAEHFLRDAGVAVVPGSAFGREGFLRLSFSAPVPVLREGFARLEKAL
jgi:aspartate aminotransferase